MKVCCIFNIPSHYREDIYAKIDQSYDCDWYFERNSSDIKLFDTNLLKNVQVLDKKTIVKRFYIMKRLVRYTLNAKYDKYLIIGAPACLSIWLLCIMLNLFYPSKKIYFWTHGWYGKENFIEAIIKRLFFKLPDKILVYGNNAKQHLVKLGFNSNDIDVIHNSLAYDKQLLIRNKIQCSSIYGEYFGNSYPVLIFIGRLTPVKQLDLLIEAIARFKMKEKYFNLVFVGSGSEAIRLNQLVHDYNISDQVWFYGECYDQYSNAELIYNADLCVAPGNVGLTAIHAMMFGCPVLTHNDFAFQMPEYESIKENISGVFFKRNNVDSLMDSIEHWFNLKGKCRSLVRKDCFNEIDKNWNPYYQLDVIKQIL